MSPRLSPARRLAAASLLFALLLVPTAPAAEPKAVPAEPQAALPEALVAEALARHPELGFYQAEIAAARAGRRVAGRWAAPEAEVEIGRKAVRDAGLSNEGMAWSVALRQPIEWPGRLGLRKAIANGEVTLAELGLERFRGAIRHQVRSVAFQLSVAQEEAEAARTVAARFRELREVLVARDPAGLTPLLETRIIEASCVKADHTAGQADREVEHLVLELNYLRGQPPATPLRVARVTPRFAEAPALESLLAAAATNNFTLRVQVAELEQQGFQVNLTQHERFPAFTIGPFFSEERAGDRERIGGVSLSAPLPLWQGNRARRDSAEARRTQAEAALEAARRQLERDVADAAQSYRRALASLAQWRPDAIRHFREAAELADRHYRLGAVPVSTYVELQRQYVEAVEALLETRRQALESGQQLQSLTGLDLGIALPPATAP
jgi:cobalt-zinc-cadmium efflux system outer membrane protein